MYTAAKGGFCFRNSPKFQNGLSRTVIFIIELTDVINVLPWIDIFTGCFVLGMRIAVHRCL